MKRHLALVLMILVGTVFISAMAHSAIYQPKPFEPGVTTDKANEAFDLIDDSLETGYVDGANYQDGCYARSLIACEKIKKWIEDEGHDECSVLTAFATDSDGPGGACTLQGPGVRWGYHQICVLRCEDKEGQWEDWYMDPAFEDGPVSQQDWIQTFCGGTQLPDLELKPGPRMFPTDNDPTISPAERRRAKDEIKDRNPRKP